MKKLKLALIASVLGVVSATSSFAQLITSFGANAATDDGWTLTTLGGGGSTLVGTESLGALVYGNPVITNFTGATSISITANVVSGSVPGNGFKFLLVNPNGKFASASFSWSSFVGGATISSPIDVIQSGFVFNGVSDWNLVGGSSNSALSVTLTSATAVTPVPEPSAYASVAGLAVLGFVAYRRRRSSV